MEDDSQAGMPQMLTSELAQGIQAALERMQFRIEAMAQQTVNNTNAIAAWTTPPPIQTTPVASAPTTTEPAQPSNPPNPPTPTNPVEQLQAWLQESELKLANPDKFSGASGENIVEFCNKLTRVFDSGVTRFQTEESKVGWAINLLTGEAYQWIEPFEELASKDRPDFYDTWDLFKAELKRKYTHVDKREAARLKLMELKQKKDVASYALEFDRLVSRLPEWNDTVKRDFFFQGLSKAVRLKMLSPGNHDTYSILVQRATTYDRQYTQQQSAPYSTQHTPSATNSAAVPMDIDSTQHNARSKLTQSDRDHRAKNGLCFYCGESGHMAKICPNKKKVGKSVNALATQTSCTEKDGNTDDSAKK
jgi:hypothetical protein